MLKLDAWKAKLMVEVEQNANVYVDGDGEAIAMVTSFKYLEPSRQTRAAAQKTSKQE